MIQIVSAYLIKQRGIVTDDDPSHITPKYVEKNRFKRWLLEDPLRFDQHIHVSLSGSTIYTAYSKHSQTLWTPEYDQTDTYSIRYRSDSKFTTLDGASSVCRLGTPTWGWLQNTPFNQSYIGSASFSTGDVAINNIQYYEFRTPTSFPFEETHSQSRSNDVPADPAVTGNTSHGGFAAQYYKRLDWPFEGWWGAVSSARTVSGVPVFTSYDDGLDYCYKVLSYIDNQTSANYQAACDAIDKCINPD